VTSTNLQTQTITRSIRYPVPSATRPEIKHVVTEDVETGERRCNCEASDHPKTRGKCWHLRAVNAGLIRPRVRVSQRPALAPLPKVTRARTSTAGLAFASGLDI
jgi:hypothetical protein